MIKIYHNNRCSKSRCGLDILKDSGKAFEIINYLEQSPTEDELIELIEMLDISPIDLVRKNEPIWKANYKGKTLTDKAIIKAMSKHPKLIERPIVVNENKAVIGRPPEKIIDLI